MTHNPFVDITNDTTTLYASDRDVFLFLVPHRGGTLAGWIAGFVFSGVLLLEQRSRIENAGHCLVLSPCRLHEPQSLGRREFRGNHYQALEIRWAAFRARGRTSADELCQFLARAVRRRDQGRAGTDRCPYRR